MIPIILISLFITYACAVYCGDMKTAGCINYCNNIKCSYGYCPLDYKETFSDCRCLACDDHDDHKSFLSYERNTHLQINHPTYDVSVKYLDHRIKQIEKLQVKFPNDYTCNDVECYKKLKQNMKKAHDTY